MRSFQERKRQQKAQKCDFEPTWWFCLKTTKDMEVQYELKTTSKKKNLAFKSRIQIKQYI